MAVLPKVRTRHAPLPRTDYSAFTGRACQRCRERFNLTIEARYLFETWGMPSLLEFMAPDPIVSAGAVVGGNPARILCATGEISAEDGGALQ
jgi:hypothetical protein